MYLINLKNFICVDIAKCQVKICLLLIFLHRFLTNFASCTGGPHEIYPALAGRELDSTELDTCCLKK